MSYQFSYFGRLIKLFPKLVIWLVGILIFSKIALRVTNSETFALVFSIIGFSLGAINFWTKNFSTRIILCAEQPIKTLDSFKRGRFIFFNLLKLKNINTEVFDSVNTLIISPDSSKNSNIPWEKASNMILLFDQVKREVVSKPKAFFKSQDLINDIEVILNDLSKCKIFECRCVLLIYTGYNVNMRLMDRLKIHF